MLYMLISHLVIRFLVDEINKELALNPDTLFYLASDDM